jgi:hypothetical protein
MMVGLWALGAAVALLRLPAVASWLGTAALGAMAVGVVGAVAAAGVLLLLPPSEVLLMVCRAALTATLSIDWME